MSETVYKVADHGPEQASRLASELAAQLPGDLVTLSSIQWSLPHVGHHYMLGESSDALYCVFMGTKFRRDLVTNANVPLKQLWAEVSGISTAAGEVGSSVLEFNVDIDVPQFITQSYLTDLRMQPLVSAPPSLWVACEIMHSFEYFLLDEVCRRIEGSSLNIKVLNLGSI